MKDRFKFRVWSEEHDRMFYTSSYDNESEYFIDNDGTLFHKSEDGDIYSLNDFSESYIVMQCTGLMDKNGALIYESDVCRWDDYIGRIIWEEAYASFIFKFPQGGDAYLESFPSLLIIGNVYQNKELLK